MSTRDARLRDQCLHELLRDQARRTPDATAVTLGHHSLSYRALEERSNQLGRYLRRLGIGREDRVGLCVERSIEMLVGMLGILKAGAAYVPLDPTYPRERLAFMLADANAQVILTQEHLVATLPSDLRASFVCLDRDWAEISRESSAWSSTAVEPDNLAYVIYTSGSSGRPKGTLVTHRSVCNVLAWLQQTHPLTADDGIVQRIPFAFDGAVCDFYWPFLAGARLIMLRPEGHRDPDYLADVIESQQGTIIVFVPSMLALLVDRPNLHSKLRGLRRAFCGGETLSPDLVRRFSECMGAKTDLVNLYGPTETTVFVTAWQCVPNANESSVPIGRPIGRVHTHILDGEMSAVSEGETGELYVAGISLARGYLDRGALTAERFLPNPFGPPGTRVYRTGDLARHRSDGVIEHLGRCDSQVKLRGFRIELGEIECALREQPGVREAVVVFRAPAPGHEQIIAYVTGDAELSVDEALDGLRGRLPEHMVPSALTVLERFPLTAHGKIDRGALPAASRIGNVDYVAPTNALEEVIASIVAETLRLERVGIFDHFLRLGMNSLQAARVAHECSDILDVTMTVTQVLAHATVTGLIAALSARGELARSTQNAELFLKISAMTPEEAEHQLQNTTPIRNPEESRS